eukprot:g33009.t1
MLKTPASPPQQERTDWTNQVANAEAIATSLATQSYHLTATAMRNKLELPHYHPKRHRRTAGRRKRPDPPMAKPRPQGTDIRVYHAATATTARPHNCLPPPQLRKRIWFESQHGRQWNL